MQIPFRYVDRNTIVHRLHPLVKILYILLTLFITLTPLLNVRYVLVPLVWLVMSIILWALARIEVSRNKFVLVDQSTNGTFVQTTSGEESFVRRDSMQIKGEGMIGLGRVPEAASPLTIRYICEDG